MSQLRVAQSEQQIGTPRCTQEDMMCIVSRVEGQDGLAAKDRDLQENHRHNKKKQDRVSGDKLSGSICSS